MNQEKKHPISIWKSFFQRSHLEEAEVVKNNIYDKGMLQNVVEIVVPLSTRRGDALKVLLDSAGTIIPDYDPEIVVSLTKFTDHLPSVFAFGFESITDFFVLWFKVCICGYNMYFFTTFIEIYLEEEGGLLDCGVSFATPLLSDDNWRYGFIFLGAVKQMRSTICSVIGTLIKRDWAQGLALASNINYLNQNPATSKRAAPTPLVPIAKAIMSLDLIFASITRYRNVFPVPPGFSFVCASKSSEGTIINSSSLISLHSDIIPSSNLCSSLGRRSEEARCMEGRLVDNMWVVINYARYVCCPFTVTTSLDMKQKLIVTLRHGAAVIDDKMYIFRGNHNRWHLSDLQALDLRIWTWSKVEVKTSGEASHVPVAPFTCHSLSGRFNDAIEFLEVMKSVGLESSSAVYNALINAYAQRVQMHGLLIITRSPIFQQQILWLWVHTQQSKGEKHRKKDRNNKRVRTSCFKIRSGVSNCSQSHQRSSAPVLPSIKAPVPKSKNDSILENLFS
ncbi:hypothetical protein CQW23_25900 [Capsicum baccatum]|uniref:Pentatricopeptide repeat-containing protein n=1 Tax=Capsicum baccatum TaxID=33114 RepID=A0A2G2VMA8_CAPBA|nr:hypothetical protein CQW23_25900 [Capsicum baccatum]